MTHDWEDVGPAAPDGDAARGVWRCRTCGSEVLSNAEPVADSKTHFTLLLLPQGWKPSGVRSDCGHMVARGVMES